MSLSDLTRREFLRLGALSAGAAIVGMPAAAEAKPLEELNPYNFSARVYHNPLPVVVLFYEADVDLKNDRSLEPSRRMEQVVEALADKYEGQVAFFRVAIDHDKLSREVAQRIFGVPDSSPLTAMYSRFDVLTGRKEAHNFQIDTKTGGPKDDGWLKLFLENTDYWIQQNLFGKSPDGDRKLYRYEGQVELHEVGVMQ